MSLSDPNPKWLAWACLCSLPGVSGLVIPTGPLWNQEGTLKTSLSMGPGNFSPSSWSKEKKNSPPKQNPFDPHSHLNPPLVLEEVAPHAAPPATPAFAPSPELTGLEVAILCMDALQYQKASEALEVCFNFSSDRCRAGVGGTLDQFVRYADNPVFGALVNCDDYEILSVGEVIPGTAHRGPMQTVYVEITDGMSMKTVQKEVRQQSRTSRGGRLTLEERYRQRGLTPEGDRLEPELDDQWGKIMEDEVQDGKRRFIWTMQLERRPPRQDCWLVHEVLSTKNVFQQTL